MIEPGNRVVLTDTKEWEQPITGTVIGSYPELDLVVVKGDDGNPYKISASSCELIEVDNANTITITREQFTEAVVRACNPELYDKKMDSSSVMMITLSGMLVCKNVEKELFGEKAEND